MGPNVLTSESELELHAGSSFFDDKLSTGTSFRKSIRSPCGFECLEDLLFELETTSAERDRFKVGESGDRSDVPPSDELEPIVTDADF